MYLNHKNPHLMLDIYKYIIQDKIHQIYINYV